MTEHDETESEHKPCPFCGCENAHPMVHTGFHCFTAHVECDNCHAKGPDTTTYGEASYSVAEEDAWDFWDNRPGED